MERTALLAALDEGRLGSYVADFPVPGLVGHPKVRFTPHLGASTKEAEENCAVMAANQLIAFLETGNISNSVNFPAVSLEPSGGHRLAITNRNVAGMLGQMTTVLAKHDINIIDMLNKSRDEVAYNLLDIEAAPDAALVAELNAIDSVINVRGAERRLDLARRSMRERGLRLNCCQTAARQSGGDQPIDTRRQHSVGILHHRRE